MRNKTVKIADKHYVTRCIIRIYLKGHKKCMFKSLPLDEEEMDQFYKEMNSEEPIMEFGNFYFYKKDLDYAIYDKVQIEVK